MPAARWPSAPWRRLAIVVLVAVAARLVTFGNPIVHTDEEFYFVFARAWAHGATPYIDIWDRKPIGLFVIYLIAALFAPATGILVYQGMALAAVVATAMLIARVAESVGWTRGATAAALLYIVWLDLADGQGGQAPVFYNLPMVAAVALVITPPIGNRQGMLAMTLVGIALQIKYSAVFEGIAIGLWLLWQSRAQESLGRTLTYGAALCGAALLPTLAALVAFVAVGAGPAFLYANFLSILARHADPSSVQIDNALTAAAILAPLLALALATAIVTRGGRATPSQRALFGWLGVSLWGVVAFGSWFNHYTLPVMVPACVCASGIFANARFGRALAGAVLTAGFAAGQIVLQAERRARGTPAQFVALVDAIGPGPGSLYVYSGTAMAYPFTGRRALSPYVLPSHLHMAREHGAIGVDQGAAIRRIFARRPDAVVMQAPIYEEQPAMTALVRAELTRRGYARSAALPLGRVIVSVYRSTTRPASRPAAY